MCMHLFEYMNLCQRVTIHILLHAYNFLSVCYIRFMKTVVIKITLKIMRLMKMVMIIVLIVITIMIIVLTSMIKTLKISSCRLPLIQVEDSGDYQCAAVLPSGRSSYDVIKLIVRSESWPATQTTAN